MPDRSGEVIKPFCLFFIIAHRHAARVVADYGNRIGGEQDTGTEEDMHHEDCHLGLGYPNLE